MFSIFNYKILIYNTISEISSNYYPNSKSSQSGFSNSISNTEDQYKSSETDSLNAQGLKSSRNKVPHVSFFLDPSGVNIGEQNSGINFNNNNTNSVQSSGSKNGKKVISLHLQFANNANPQPLNENSVSASLKQKIILYLLVKSIYSISIQYRQI